MRQTLGLSLFAFCCVVGVADVFVVEAFSLPSQSTKNSRSLSYSTRSHYPSFQLGAQSARDYGKNEPNSLIKRITRGRLSRKIWPIRSSKLLAKMRRSISLLSTAIIFWFGASGLRASPSHASTAAAPGSESRALSSPSLVKIVDGYVKDHMFDDDVYEPVESVYREAIGDKIKGAHPRALSEVTASTLGQGGIRSDKTSATGIGGIILNGVNFLKARGLSESMAIIILTGSFVVAGPIAFVCAGMIVGAQSKRQINRVMKQRYGDTYTVDATIKEDDVEAPDDDEEDEDDEDEEDDDDDED